MAGRQSSRASRSYEKGVFAGKTCNQTRIAGLCRALRLIKVDADSSEEQFVKPARAIAVVGVLFGSIIAAEALPDDQAAAVGRGFKAFTDGRLDGLGANGRACSDCHTPTDHFQLSPDNVEQRYRILSLRRLGNPDADDPLFRPIDADDFRLNGDQAGDFTTLRRHALIRVTLPLPSNGYVRQRLKHMYGDGPQADV